MIKDIIIMATQLYYTLINMFNIFLEGDSRVFLITAGLCLITISFINGFIKESENE